MGEQDMLQKPFNEKEFTKFFKEYKNSKKFRKLYVKMKEKYYGYDLADIDSIINQAIYYAYKTHLTNSNCKITSWIESNIRWSLCKFHLVTSKARNKYKKNPIVLSLDYPIDEDKKYGDIIADENATIYEDNIDARLFTLKHIINKYIPYKEDIVNHYIGGMTYKALSDLHGVSHQAIEQRIKYSLNKIKNKFKKKGISYVF